MNQPLMIDTLWCRRLPCPYDDVIDVRSPVEFAEDHVPGAVNLPVLSNAERVEVGTIYRVDGAFAARKLGAAYVSANISRHLRDHFATKPKEYKPLIYCWRGGQRSASLAIVLAQVGWRVSVLRGGYKTYREHVRRELDLLPGQFTYRLIAGATGTGKTRLLHALARQGAQALDLEALARHRGSLLGGDGPQPSQKGFESQLLTELERYDPGRPVWVEAESNRIGNLHLPASLWQTMRCAIGVELRVPIEQRVRQLLADYAHFVNDPDSLCTQLARISRRHGARQLSEWSRLIDAGSWGEFVASLLRIHYDPAYEQSARKCFPNLTRYRDLHDTTCATLATLATELRLESSDTISLTSPL